jgi:TonB family protein
VPAKAPRLELPQPQIELAAPKVRQAGFSQSKPELPTPTPAATLQTGSFSLTEVQAVSGLRRSVRGAAFGAVERARLGKPSRRVLSSARFDAAAAAAPSRTGAAISVGAFAAVKVAIPSASLLSEAPSVNDRKPLRILHKPDPAYSAPAREAKIEGEVVLLVRFDPDGSVEVLRVLSGLGYGLDENAIAAAGHIRFEPAERFGRPVATTATVRINFQMAY